MSRDKSDGNMIASSIPSSFEKRLMALEFDMKRKNENHSNKGTGKRAHDDFMSDS